MNKKLIIFSTMFLLLGTLIMTADKIDKANARELLAQGDKKLKDRLFTEAILSYDRAIELDPELKQAYNHRGLAKSYLGNFPASISDYDKAIQLDDKFKEAYYNRALAKYSTKNYASCIADFDKLIQLDEKDAEAYFLRGSAKTYVPGIAVKSACEDFHKAKALGYRPKQAGQPDADFMIVKYCSKEE